MHVVHLSFNAFHVSGATSRASGIIRTPFPPNFNVARVERGGADFSLLIQDGLATCNTGIGGREGDA